MAQELYKSQYKLSLNDSVLLSNLQQIKLPEIYKYTDAKELPEYHDNSQLPFFRSIINQEGWWACGQFSSIGYAYTYELNRVRNTSADTSINQYSPLYTWNFFNNGEDQFGVCFYYSFEAIKSNGHPNIYDYGGLALGSQYWVNGYDKYYRGMFNQLDDVYSIYVGDEEGIQTIKYYLYDHLDGSEFGGIANFYTDYYGFTLLPPGTPEEGKCVVDHWGYGTGHSMTIVGWNDSIRYDYNGDNQYTNDIDIDGDGIVTVKDWEIGGFKFVNSFGPEHADSGFCYVMYKAMAEEKPSNGVWNKSVYIQMVEGDYVPLLAFKVKLKHNSRNKIKLITGISTDTTDSWPQFTIDYDIFDYQGGDHYMQGNDTIEQHKTIEIGLDATPLLSHLNPGEPAKYFFQVHEHDPINKGNGEVLSFSLMDYIAGGIEIPCPMGPVPVVNNGFTNLSVIHATNPDKVNIITDELPAFEINQDYEYLLEAEGGEPPYNWSIVSDYNESQYSSTYQQIDEEELIPGGNFHGYVSKEISFEFPYYGKSHNEITLFIDGFLGFAEESLPIPYQADDMVLFKYVKLIAPFLSNHLQYISFNDDEIYYEGNEEYAAFRWNTSLDFENDTYKVDFTVYLYPNGDIEFYYGDFEIPASIKWITGLSAGEEENYQVSEFSNLLAYKSNEVLRFTPQNILSDFSITDNGLLSAQPTNNSSIYNITARVTDNFRISAIKNFQLSSGIIYDIEVISGIDNQIDYGEDVKLNISLKNISTTILANVEFNIDSDDPFITIEDDFEEFGELSPGETKIIENAIKFTVDPNIPDEYYINFTNEITSDSHFWEGQFNLKALAPKLEIGTPVVNDNDNGWLDPGETSDIIIPLINYGHSSSQNVERSLTALSPYITINNGSTLIIGDIPKGETYYDSVNVTVDNECPEGLDAGFEYNISSDPNLFDSFIFDLTIGRFPVLVIDMDPAMLSGYDLQELLETLGIYYEYKNAFPNELDQFRNVFVLLGKKYIQHTLTEYQGELLANFLMNSGNVYLEGGITWYEDPPTAVHPLFNIIAESISWNEIDTVIGIPGTFTQYMDFNYSGTQSYYNHYLTPIEPAYSILKRSIQPHNYAVAYDNGDYKTIGSNILFGLLENGEGISTKENLLKEYLIFFGLESIITEINNSNNISNDYSLICYPNPVSHHSIIQFTLQETQSVKLSVINLFGKEVKKIYTKSDLSPGTHQVDLRINDLPNGIYMIKLQTKTGLTSIKVVVSN